MESSKISLLEAVKDICFQNYDHTIMWKSCTIIGDPFRWITMLEFLVDSIKNHLFHLKNLFKCENSHNE